MKASNKSKKLKNSNNLNKSNELSNLIEQNNNSITNNKTSNLNTSVNILNESYIKKNNLNKLTKISKHNSNVFKSNKEMSQIFVDYKTFIKGKPYSELSQEYKQGIEIGEGGFGKVRTIIHKKTGQLRAMKLIKKSKEFNLDEIENLMLLNHPNILKLFEYYYDEEENIYIITEYIRGEELFNKIQEVYRFSEEDSAIIIKSVLQAITYCHSRGIIHRDLKPENILIPSGSNKVDYTLLKIIDFGASVLKKDDGKISFRFGTPYYIAPEVLQESYNEKCDVWSIGVILYLLLIGQAPFDGEDDDIICQKIISEEIDYENNKKIKELSNEAVDFMKKLLEKNPDKRISSAQALEHVWLKKYAPHTKVNKAFSKKIYKNLSNFREQSQLSTAVTTFMTNYLMNDDELKLLKKLFFELDVKGVGVITRDELYRGMVECFGDKITREEVDKIFSNIDYDNNGTISFDEFVKAAIDKKKLLTEEKLKAAFSLFDRNGDGDIEAKELKEVIGDDSNIDNNVWLQMIKEVDLDGNGVIDFEEFKDMMQKLCS
jgi:calcium-dependent protein kinase